MRSTKAESVGSVEQSTRESIPPEIDENGIEEKGIDEKGEPVSVMELNGVDTRSPRVSAWSGVSARSGMNCV